MRTVAFTWGLCAYFPVGVVYLNLLLMLVALAILPAFGRRVARVRNSAVFWPIVLMLGWTFFIAIVGHWSEDTPTRLFHVARVALVLCLGLALELPEARAGLAGFLLASVLAALVVAVHHLWALPPWAIWSSLLASRNNFSSGNMITMATASGVFFFIGICGRFGKRRAAPGLVAIPRAAGRATAGLAVVSRYDAWLALAAALALALTVAFHAVSRNSQLLLVVLLLGAVLFRFRSLRSALTGALVVVALLALLWSSSATTRGRFAELADNLHNATAQANYATSGGVRLRMYREAVQGMSEHPLLGTGVGSWRPRWHTVFMGLNTGLEPDIERVFAEINNPHNDFLLAGMETGVPGLLILAWLLGRFIVQGWRTQSLAGGVGVVFGVSLFATALVNAPLRDAALGMTLLWLLGLSLAAQHRAGDA